ncbi:MAG: MFS transporter [Chitinophagales bacterium]|nr:MFS transporter [Chitinophagales bacterium]
MRNARAVWLLLLANSISGVAQGISMLAIPWYFTGVIHSETLYGKIFFAATVVSMFWGLYAGTLIDRYDRKKIFLAINLAGLLVTGSVTASGFAIGSIPWQAVALVFATTMFVYNIHFPNLYAYAQEITPKEDYGRVTSLLEIQGQLTFTLAGACAAILLKGIEGSFNFFGHEVVLPFSIRPLLIHEIFAIDAVTYIIAFLIIHRIHSLPVVDRHIDVSPLRERLKTGIRFLKQHPLIFHFGNASLLLFLTILVFGLYVMPVYVDKFLKKGGDVYAIGDMAFSFGALLAGFVTTKIFGDKTAVRGIIMLSALAGLMYAVMMASAILTVFFLAQFVIGACNASVRIQRITYMFHHIPNKVIGRTGSVFFMLNVFFRVCLIALFTIPFFHEGTNILYAVAVLAAICFAAALILGVKYKALVAEPVTN